jgi:LuxR family maltose regulon positive regulatory protein
VGYAEPHGLLRSVLDAGPGIERVIAATLDSYREEDRDTAYLERMLQSARAERRVEPKPQQGLVEPLSARELDVLRLIAAGHTNAEIADALFVVVGTVKAHAFNIYGKLGVRTRTQAVNRARELRLVD